MAAPKIGAVLALSGEQEFRRAITAVNSAYKELKTETKIVTAEFSGQANTMETLTAKHENLEKQKTKLLEKIELQAKALDEMEKKQKKEETSLGKASEAYKEATKKLDELKKSTEASTESIEEQEKAVKEAEKELKTAERAYTAAEKKTNDWRTSLNSTIIELGNIDDQIDKTNQYIKEAEESIDGTAQSIDEFGNEVKEASEQTKVFGGVLAANLASELIIDGVKRLSTGILEIGKYSLNAGKEFESAMSQVAATMGIANNEVEDTTGGYKVMQEAAKAAGEATKYSAAQAAEALNYLALAGYNAEKAANTLPAVLDLAAAGGMDLAYASDVATDSMAALGIATDDFVNFTDQMAVTSQKSNTSVSQLGEAILTIGGTAKQLAGGTVELNTALGILADNGIKGAEGGTMLRNALKNLTAPTADASNALKEYGIRVYDAEGNMRPLNETMEDLAIALNGLSDQERAQVMNRIFDSRVLKGAEALIANCADRFDELSGYIADADGAAEKMAKTMSNNLAGALDELDSVAETTGITLYNKFEKSFKNITSTATAELGKINKQLESGKLGKNVDHLSEQFEEVAGSVIDLGEKALPVAVDLTSALLENCGEIATAVTAIGTGIATFKTAQEIEKVVTNFKELSNAVKTSESAMNTLNVVTGANPYVVLATAVATATAALVVYTATCTEAKTEAQKMNAQIRESIDDNKEFNSGLKDNVASIRENSGAQENSLAAAKRLSEELKKLNSIEKLSTQDKYRMKSIVEQLNTLMPELNLSIDEQTGYLNKTNAEVEDLVENYTNLVRAQYYQEELTEIVKQQCEVEEQLAELYEVRGKATEALSLAEADLSAYLKEHNITLEELNKRLSEGSAEGSEYAYTVTVSKAALQELDNQIATTEESVAMLGEEYAATSEKISNHSGVDETANSMDALAEGAEEAAVSLESTANSMELSFLSMSESVKEVVAESINIFDKYEIKTEASKEKILSNMQSQIDGMTEWGDNLSALAGRADENGMMLSEGLLQHLVNLGPEGAGYVAAFVSMTDEELKKANELWTESIRLPDTIAQQFAESGAQMAEGLVTGIEENEDGVTDAMKKTVKNTVDAANKEAEINSPSKKTMKTGEGMDEGLALGIKNKEPVVINAMRATAEATLKEAKATLNESSGLEIGLNFIGSVAKGIIEGKSEAVNAAVQVAKSIVSATKAELQINSPSKKGMEIGSNYIGSIGLGARAETQNLKDAITDTVSEGMSTYVAAGMQGNSLGVTLSGASGNTIGTLQMIFQPQQMTETELERAFDYVNNRLGYAL